MARSMSVRVTIIPSTRAYLFLALMPLLLNGCQDHRTAENERIREEIIRVHDEAMEKIGYMYELETRLQTIENHPRIADAKPTPTELAISHLQQANKSMFDWMHQYQTLAVSKEISSDTRYRIEQLEKIERVQRLTMQAIARAEELLGIRAP